jgi:hypothetical protein
MGMKEAGGEEGKEEEEEEEEEERDYTEMLASLSCRRV